MCKSMPTINDIVDLHRKKRRHPNRSCIEQYKIEKKTSSKPKGTTEKRIKRKPKENNTVNRKKYLTRADSRENGRVNLPCRKIL